MKILMKQNIACAYMDPSVPALRFKKDQIVDGSTLEDRMLKTILREKYGVLINEEPKEKKLEVKEAAVEENKDPIVKKKPKKKKGSHE